PLLDIRFLDKEQLPETDEDRSGIYDLFCRDVAGNHFIVEMQKNYLAWVKDRMLYYATFPIVAQAKKGKLFSGYVPEVEGSRIREPRAEYGEKMRTKTWNYELSGVYCIAILSYALDHSKKAVNRNSLRNDEPPHELFYDKLKFVTIELPLFDETKPEYSLDNHLNKWLYFLKYLPSLDRIPDIFKNEVVFQKAFRIAELAKLKPAERMRYEKNWRRIWDNQAVLETRYNQGLIKGKSDGKIEGELKGKTEALLLILTQKLGPAPEDVVAAIRALREIDQLDRLIAHALTIDNWEALRQALLSI
ncbi:MAG: PD-(D/E)XK nuclease family transposase, partial [candidate division KSB1 bacterium]